MTVVRKIYQKALDKLENGTWGIYGVPISNYAPKGETVIFKCPNGHIGMLDDHTIKDDGEVNPSVVCPKDGCDFHEWITLEGWSIYR